VRASVLGIVLALLALATFTAYWVLTRSARRDTDVDPIGWMTGVNIWAVVSAVPPVVLFTNGDDWSRFGGLDWLWIVMIALLTGALGHVMMSWVHAYVEAARSSLYMLDMHVVAVGLSWPIHGEPVTVVQVIGGVVVLLCVAMVIRIPPRTE